MIGLFSLNDGRKFSTTFAGFNKYKRSLEEEIKIHKSLIEDYVNDWNSREFFVIKHEVIK